MSYDGDSSTSLGIGPNVGYAFGRANSTMFPYLIAGFHYKRSMSEGHRTFGADAIVGGGIVAPIKQHLGIVIEACYHIMDSKLVDANESTSSNAFIVGIGFAGLLF